MYFRETDVTFFDSFGVEHILKEIKAFIDRSLSIATNILALILLILCLQEKPKLIFQIFFPQITLKNDNITLNYFMTNV